MIPVFDTNILIDFVLGRKQAKDEIERYEQGAISMISWIEVLVGANSQQEKAALEVFLRRFIVLDVTKPIASEAVVLRKANKLRLPDAIILATAIHRQTLLITRDSKDFMDSPHVRIPYVL